MFYFSRIENNNIPFFYFFVILQFLFFLRIYFVEVSISSAQNFFRLLAVTFPAFAVVTTLVNGISSYNPYVKATENLLLIGLSVYYFYYLNKTLPILYLERFYMFWINTGILIYFSGTLLLFALGEYLTELAQPLSLQLWNIHLLLNILLNLFFSVAFWVNRRTYSTT